jgi:DNA-binding FadR family transcriptional regulator
MGVTQITNERLSDKVVQMIMDQVKSGEMKPGDKLPSEPELAEILGVSRGILREALNVLQARNYIVRKPKEGTFINKSIDIIMENVNGISLKKATYLDLLEMRECIEQCEVKKIIDTADDKEIEELQELIMDTDIAGNNGKSVDYYFHYRLAELSKNAMFVNFIDTYYDVIDELSATIIKKKAARKEEIIKEHKDIVKALRARDKDRAVDAVVTHLEHVKDNIKRLD